MRLQRHSHLSASSGAAAELCSRLCRGAQRYIMPSAAEQKCVPLVIIFEVQYFGVVPLCIFVVCVCVCLCVCPAAGAAAVMLFPHQ